MLADIIDTVEIADKARPLFEVERALRCSGCSMQVPSVHADIDVHQKLNFCQIPLWDQIEACLPTLLEKLGMNPYSMSPAKRDHIQAEIAKSVCRLRRERGHLETIDFAIEETQMLHL